VEDASNLNAIIGMRIASILAGHKQTVILLTDLLQIGRVVMAVAQDEAHFGRNLA
jgi:hypothetical protein